MHLNQWPIIKLLCTMALFIITSIHLCMVEAEGDETDVSGTKNAMKNMTGKRGREWAPDRRHEAFCLFCLSSVWPFTHTLTHTDTQDTWKHRYSGTLCTQIYIHKLAKHRYNHINTHTYTHTHTEINRHQYVHAEIHTKTQHELRECARECV